MVKDKESQTINKLLKRFGQIKVSTNQVEGVITIKRYRKYTYKNEVDVFFNGKIRVRLGFTPSDWYSSEYVKKYGTRISTVKLNRFIRKSVFKEVKERMSYFEKNINWYSDIKKLNWE